MKFLVFQGGLGNQLFQYAYYQYIRTKYPNQNIYMVSLSKSKLGHYGLEIDKWFDVKLPKQNFISKTVGYLLYKVNRFNYNHHLPIFLTSVDDQYNESKPLYYGYWQDVRFLEKKSFPKFKKDLKLNDKNLEVLKKIKSTNSVAVHVRRGDYLKGGALDIYGGICTEEYYKKAIEMMNSKLSDPSYYFFSYDPDYIYNAFDYVDKKTVVSWNTGQNSFLDMYLMSHAGNMILANSSFSCWAAYLNHNNGNIICPVRWTNKKKSPNVKFENWINIL